MGKYARKRDHLWAACALCVSTITLGFYIPQPPAESSTEQPPDQAQEPAGQSSQDTHAFPKWPAAAPATPKPSPAKSKPSPRPTATPTHVPSPAPKETHSPQPVSSGSSTRLDRLLAFLRAQVGERYVWGGTGPNAWDCSGLTQTAFERVGVELPRTAESQSLVGRRVSLDDLRAGDLLFWGVPGAAYHVAVYIGGGKYIAAENPRTGVVLQSMSFYRPDFARRVL